MTETSRHTPESASARRLFGMRPETLGELVIAWNQPGYRAGQVLEWVYRRGAQTYDEMTNLPNDLRLRLARELPIFESKILLRRQSNDGTTKLLLAWADGATSECVLIPGASRHTACISTQVGCPVGCVFCASGLDGLERQLSAGQIVEQAMRVRALCEPSNRLSNVVFMGLGEPLANFDATVGALRTISADWGMAIGARKITVSTVGLPGQMRKLADEKTQITLALSLHAPSDELRRELIPWAKNVTIDDLIEAANYYFDRTGREVTLEYVLIGGLNDAESHARRLASISKRMRSNVNLIRYSAVDGLPFEPPSDKSVRAFHETLTARGVNAHLRRSRGLDIEAACGQLRRRS